MNEDKNSAEGRSDVEQYIYTSIPQDSKMAAT